MALKHRYDFMMIFDVENGNPNGDPDAGNSPRVDAETNIGFITDVCLKRKIRNYVDVVKEGEAGYNILVKPDKALNTRFTEAYEALGLETGKKEKSKTAPDVLKARDYMCEHYFDVRAFGAVMSTGDNPCGIVRGPVQISFAKSLSPVQVMDLTITRQARTDETKLQESGGGEMGNKSIIPYGLYMAQGHISAALANKVTDLSEADVALLWEALINMFELDHSAARGEMRMRRLIVFEHDSVLGNAPSWQLFDKVTIEKNTDQPPRKFSDYTITIDETMPEGVHMTIY